MKEIIIIVIVILVFSIYTKSTSKRMTPEQVEEIVGEKGTVILDVRTPEEYAEGHIKGALLIPNYDLGGLAEKKLRDKDANIIIYCRSGSRSKGATKVLQDMGYKNVHDFGGISRWTGDIVKGSK